MIENIQEIYCGKCGRYLFTEYENNDGYRRKNDNKNYIYNEVDDEFICEKCNEYMHQSNIEIKNRLCYRLLYDKKEWWMDITDIAKDFSGDVLQKVEISIAYNCSEYKAMSDAECILAELKDGIRERKEINFNSESAIITFINGKQIKIWNSEYGGFDMLNDID